MSIYTDRDNDRGSKSEAESMLEYDLRKRGIRKCNKCNKHRKGNYVDPVGWICNKCYYEITDKII